MTVAVPPTVYSCTDCGTISPARAALTESLNSGLVGSADSLAKILAVRRDEVGAYHAEASAAGGVTCERTGQIFADAAGSEAHASRLRVRSLAHRDSVILSDRSARHVTARCRANRAAHGRSRASVRAIVARDDVDHAADGVGTVKSGTLWAANDLNAIDGFRSELRYEQRIGQLDSVNVHLWVAGTERAGAANTSVVSERRCRRGLPDPQSRHQIAQCLRQISLGVPG